MDLSEITKILFKNGLIYINRSPFYHPNFILQRFLTASWGSSNILVCQKTNIFDNDLFVYVFGDGSVRFIFKDIPYVFENPFEEEYLIPVKFQLFVHDNIVVLLYGINIFVSFVFEKGVFSKIEFKQHNEWPYKNFVERNVRVLCIRQMILSFTLENGTFTKRYYPIRHGIDGGILTFVEGTPYFVCCIHPRNYQLIVVSINLETGKQNTVLKMGEYDSFCSFKHKNSILYIITTSPTSQNHETKVNPRKICETHETRESWCQDGGIICENLLENVEHNYS
jgi:hypothetical protein